MNFYTLNETPINGHATLLGSAAASMVLSGTAHGVKSVKGSASASLALSTTAKSLVYWHPNAQAGIVVSPSASSKIAIRGTATADIAVTMSARPMVRVQAKASSGLIVLTTEAIAQIHFKPNAAMPIDMSMTAAARIVRVHYPKAAMQIMIDAGAATKVTRSVFASAKFEPITLGSHAGGKMIANGKAFALIELTATATSKGYRRIFGAAAGDISFHARASSAVWRHQYGSASALIATSMCYGGGMRPIPAIYAPAPDNRLMAISADQRIFTIAAEERTM